MAESEIDGGRYARRAARLFATSGRWPLTVMIVAAIVAVGACSSANDSSSPSADDVPSPVDWPVDLDGIAVISGPGGLAVTDGSSVTEVVRSPVPIWAVGSASADGDLLAIDAGEEVMTINLSNGSVARRACAGCNGVAVIGDEVVTADGSFTIHRFDPALRLHALIPVDHVVEPLDPEGPREPDPIVPTVLGAVDGRIAMSYRTTNGIVRGGPEVVSLYTPEGRLERSWAVDGIVYSSATDARNTRLLLGVGGSGGACYTLSTPVVIEPSMTEPAVLVDDSENDRSSGRQYAASDLWWNGPQAVVFGTLSGNGASGCHADHSLRQFDMNRETASEEIRAITAYRFLGPGCDRALMVDASIDVPVLTHIDGQSTHAIQGYDSIVWSPPRVEPCNAFVGVDGP